MSGGDELLPYSLRGLPVRIHPLSKTELRQIFSQTFSSFREPIYSNFEFGTLVLSRGVTAPTITQAEAAGLEPQIFTAILSRILEISGVGLKRKETRYLVESLPDDASYEEIMRELAFERMVERGFEDSRKGRVISNEEMEHRIRIWQR